MENMKNTKKRMMALLAGIVALALFAGTWAYFTSSSSIDNLLHTNSYGAKTLEEFTPGQALEPGVEIEKKVGVTNTGDYDLVVRVKFDEKWAREGVAFKEIAHSGAIDTVAYTAPSTWTATQVNDTDGVVPAGDETVVFKTLNPGGDWIKGGDGYWYYKTRLTAGQTTGNVLESIILASNADIGSNEVNTYYSTAAKATIEAAIAAGSYTPAQIEAMYGWTTTAPLDESTITYIKSESALAAGFAGYANADYTLTITTEVCQATSDAVAGSWDMAASAGANLPAIKAAWALG